MNTITKLISNNWISFNPGTKLFSIDLLHEEGSGFLLDLKDESDLSEFNNLLEYVITGNTRDETIELENISSTLTFEWKGSLLKLFHSTEESRKGFLIDALVYSEADELLAVLKRISKLIGE